MNIFSQYTIKIKKLVNNLKNKGKIDLPSNLDSVIVDIPPKKFLGDISCNVAMIISKINKKNPIDIANLISNEIKDKFDEVDEISVAKPGFLNLKFKNSFWNQFLKEIIQNKNCYGIDNQNNKKNYLIEFVSANPTGPLHVGHCRGAILGDVISNV
jgi:arginyl-tRNA synthetase